MKKIRMNAKLVERFMKALSLKQVEVVGTIQKNRQKNKVKFITITLKCVNKVTGEEFVIYKVIPQVENGQEIIYLIKEVA